MMLALEPGVIVADVGRGRQAGGTVAPGAARHVDILPTVLAAVGLPAQDLPGRSLLTAAERNDATPRPSYFEAMSAMLNRGWAPLQGVMAGREKFVDLPKPELYDLAADPKEAANLADQRTDRRRALEIRLQDFHAPAPGERLAETSGVAARLQSLGYTSGGAPRKAQYTEDDDPKRPQLLAIVKRLFPDDQYIQGFSSERGAE